MIDNENILQVEDRAGLVRDKISKAIINTNTSDRNKYLARKAAMQAKDTKIESLENRISELERTIADLIKNFSK